MAGPYSKYPNQIDDTSSLPLATDLSTEVKAECVNRLNDAIVQIEKELGVNPSDTYSTVRDRLDYIETHGGGGGGGGDITVLYDGTIISSTASRLNFKGGVNVSGSVTVDVEIPSTVQVQEDFVVSNGQTSFTLSDDPFQVDAVQLFVNGIRQTYGVDFSVLGSTLTWNNLTPLISTDIVGAWYLVSVSTSGGGGGSAIKIQEGGVDKESNVTTMNFIDSTVTSVSPGVVSIASGGSSVKSKIKVYRSTTNQTGNAVGVVSKVAWNGTSTNLTSSNANLSGTGIAPSLSGTFMICGQLTLQPTINAVSGIVIDVLLNSSVVHTFTKTNGVFAIGDPNSFSFNITLDLLSADILEIQWKHLGDPSSEVELLFGEQNSWFSFISI